MTEYSYVYLLTEGNPVELAALRSRAATPKTYKVGKAEWGKRRPDPLRPFLPAEDRQSKAQSCNPNPIGVLRLFGFANDSDARRVEAAFHAQYREVHGVNAYEKHEWYRASLSVEEVCSFMLSHGGVDVSDLYPPVILPASYEEGPCEFRKGQRGAQPLPLSVYVMQVLEGGTSWFRVLATSYRDQRVERWYNTGNPRVVTQVRKLAPKHNEDAAERNTRVRSLMASVIEQYGSMQAPVATKRGAAWNTLAWVASADFLDAFDKMALAAGLATA